MGILGGIVKWILSPLTSWMSGLLYSIFVHGPLTLLNLVSNAFEYVSGANVDKLLFSTSVIDGKPELNFFASDSPLKTFFLLMLGISGALLAAFLGISLLSSIMKKKGQGGPINKMGKVILNSTLVFAVPSVFLIVLSLSGGLMSALSGGHVDMSKQNITQFKAYTSSNLQSIKTKPPTMIYSFDTSQKITSQQFNDANNKPVQGGKSLDDILLDIQNKAIFKTSDTVKQIATQAQDAFQNMKSLIVERGQGNNFVLNSSLDSSITSVQGVINNLKPKHKDNVEADKVQALATKLQAINSAVNNWVKLSKTLSTYEGSDMTNPQNIALRNYRMAFEYIYGNKDMNALLKINQIKTIQDLNQIISYVINGDPNNPGMSNGLLFLKSTLSTLEQNPLVTAFYKVATGNSGSNWDMAQSSFKTNNYMLVIGGILSAIAAGIMFMACLFAVERIFNIALLFIISPVIVTTSVFDDGARMKTWINMVIAKLISIFAIVISLRLFGTLSAAFWKNLGTLPSLQGNAGFMLKNMLTTIFGIGGLLAAYHASSTLSGIVGAGYGIMDGLQVGRTMGALRGVASPFKSIGRGLGKTTGFSKGGGVGGYSAKASGSSPRDRLGSVAETWKGRAQNINNKATKLSRGKLGTINSRASYFKNKHQKFNNKLNASKETRKNKNTLSKQRDKAIDAKQSFKSYKKNNRKGGK